MEQEDDRGGSTQMARKLANILKRPTPHPKKKKTKLG